MEVLVPGKVRSRCRGKVEVGLVDGKYVGFSERRSATRRDEGSEAAPERVLPIELFAVDMRQLKHVNSALVRERLVGAVRDQLLRPVEPGVLPQHAFQQSREFRRYNSRDPSALQHALNCESAVERRGGLGEFIATLRFAIRVNLRIKKMRVKKTR